MMKDRRDLVPQGLRSVPQAAKLEGNSTLPPVFRPPFPVLEYGV